MNLILDIGNTRGKSALFENRELVQQDSFSVDKDKITQIIEQHQGIIILSSVVEINFLVNPPTNHNLMVLSHKTPIPIKNSYQSPETLGHDRIANAVAISTNSKSGNALSIDCGTCLKFDLLINNEYLGGSISPGLQMRFKALHTFTDKLPLIEPKEFEQLNGMNTQDSILSGCYRGMLAEIKQTMADYESQFGKLDIYLTGGDHLFFANHLKNCIFADPFLTLKGLNEILLFQNT